MKIEKLPSGSYRVRKMYKKKTFTLIFPYKPTQKEVIVRMAEVIENAGIENYTMKYYSNKYIDSKRNVLSPSTILTYERLTNVISKEFLKKRLGELTQLDVQEEINRYSENHSPKSVKSLHGFIASVLGVYRPNMTLRTTLPQKIIKDRYLPSESDIKSILDKAKGTCDSVAFQLGILSLRRSEICALELEDLKGNELHIHSNMVYNEENEWVKKESPKTDASNRIVYLPESLVEEIHEQGYFFKYTPPKLNEHLHKYQKELRTTK